MSSKASAILFLLMTLVLSVESKGHYPEALSDTIIPMPRLDSVSIDFITQEVLVGWEPSTADFVTKYYVYHDGSINNIHDSVFGRFNTFYRDTLFESACAYSMAYAISAADDAGNVGPGTYDELAHRTIHLEQPDFDPCLMINKLSWTAYVNMDPVLEGYRVYLSIDGAPFEVHATVYDSVTEYEHIGLDPGRTYRYFIRAFSEGNQVTSSSCIRELNTWQYRRPADNAIENTTVESSSFVSLSLLPDTFATVPQLLVYRSQEAAGPWSMIDTVEVLGQDVVYYNDETADVNSTSYYYYSSLIDSCGNEVLASDTFRTIYLEGGHSGQFNSLEWNAFEGWPVAVEKYEIYRAVNDDGSFELAGETAGNDLSFEDNISSLPGDLSMLRYVVRALQDDSASLYSWSNEIFFEYDPRIYLPNAFRPGGKNSVFRPVGSFADFSEYRMDIYNRWGELIFSSEDFGLGWDGSLKGSDAPGGVYVCVLNYRSADGGSGTMKSTFVLLR